MVGIIVISENKSAVELLKTVKKILGKRKLSGIKPLVIKSDMHKKTFVSKVQKLIAKLKATRGVLIMTELYGSTQSNVCREFLHKDQVELVCGYNLPMLITAATLNHKMGVTELAMKVAESGKKYIKSYLGHL